ncbi:hypothetical protein CYLTODRAFT_486615 [Cylindrobasidium torrendii FP15055 ss-10]|uniref:Uncharacterized protein n=1 Tax=Cylindrobasidium torrendii FP15055 ss-10 TaxID=1314674 RepID=A0A0D7BNW6_9AGAR|nr:hypothetical protein CYLTODRAFT_486615 [Cylindrobasidium torrendii FP15055 ss-10]
MPSVDDLCKEVGVPRPEPYMYGFHLTLAQARMMAERHCTPAELKDVGYAYNIALVLHANKHGLAQTFIPYIHRGEKWVFWAFSVRAVWVKRSGEDPRVRWEAPEVPREYLCAPGLELEFGELEKGVMRWPRCWDPPDWLWPLFMDSARQTLEYTLKMGRPQQAKASPDTSATTPDASGAEAESTTNCKSDYASTTPLDASTTLADASSTNDTPFIVQSMRYMP